MRSSGQQSVVSCVEPGGALELGGAQAVLSFRRGWPSKDDVVVAVPVDDATGLDAGDRVTVGRKQRTALVVVPADGRTQTPAVTIEVRRGGDVLQRVPVAAGCGVEDAQPVQGPVVVAVTVDAAAGTVAAQIANSGNRSDEIGVTLYPVGGSVGETRFLSLAPGQSGEVSLSGVAPGRYSVEAFGYTTFAKATSEPFTVG